MGDPRFYLDEPTDACCCVLGVYDRHNPDAIFPGGGRQVLETADEDLARRLCDLFNENPELFGLEIGPEPTPTPPEPPEPIPIEKVREAMLKTFSEEDTQRILAMLEKDA